MNIHANNTHQLILQEMYSDSTSVKDKQQSIKLQAIDNAENILPDWQITDKNGIRFRPGTSIFALDSSPDGKYIAYNQKNIVLIYDPQQRTHLNQFIGYNAFIRALKYSPNGYYLAFGFCGSKLKVNIIILDSRRLTIFKQLIGHKKTITQLVFSPNNVYLVTSSWDKKIKIWYLKKGKLVRQFKSVCSINSLDYSPNGKDIIFGDGSDYSMLIINVQCARQITRIYGHSASVMSVKYSQNGQLIVSAGFDQSIQISNAINGQLISKLIGYQKRIHEIAISSDQNYIISGSEDGTICLWLTKTCELVGSTYYPKESINRVQFSQCGRFIISGTGGSALRIMPLDAYLTGF